MRDRDTELPVYCEPVILKGSKLDLDIIKLAYLSEILDLTSYVPHSRTCPLKSVSGCEI